MAASSSMNQGVNLRQFEVPAEAVVFIGSVIGFLLLLVVFFLYLNKKLCFHSIGGFPCCDHTYKSSSPKRKATTGQGDDQDTSSDSDDEVINTYRTAMSTSTSRQSFRSMKRTADSISKDLAATLHTHEEETHVQISDEQIVITIDKPEESDAIDASDLVNRLEVTASGEQTPSSHVGVTLCGSLHIHFHYAEQLRKLTVKVLEAKDLPHKDRGGAAQTEVHVVLLPGKKQRFKTHAQPGVLPEYNESFTFTRIQYEEQNNLAIRFRLYAAEKIRRERLIGEAVMPLTAIRFDRPAAHWIALDPRTNMAATPDEASGSMDTLSLSHSDSMSSSQQSLHVLQHGGIPELLAGLAYNGTTGRLSVEVIKGSNFRDLSTTRPPDTYVKLTLLSSEGQEMSRSKTSIRKAQSNPLFRETFVFPVAQFQLPNVTLMIAAYAKRGMKRKEMIGWCLMGLNNTSEEEYVHWADMKDNAVRAEQVCRWHVLLAG